MPEGPHDVDTNAKIGHKPAGETPPLLPLAHALPLTRYAVRRQTPGMAPVCEQLAARDLRGERVVMLVLAAELEPGPAGAVNATRRVQGPPERVPEQALARLCGGIGRRHARAERQ